MSKATPTYKKCIAAFGLFILLLSLPGMADEQKTATENRGAPQKIGLTAEEQAWLSEHPVIHVGAEIDFPPFEYRGPDGSHLGISAEIVHLVAEQLGIELVIHHADWSTALAKVRSGEWDLLAQISPTPERVARGDILFTKPYIDNPHVIVSRMDADAFESLHSLIGKKVAVEKDYYTQDILKREPGIKQAVVDDALPALTMVITGEADAYIGNIALVNNKINEHGLTNLQFSPAKDIGTLDLSIGVRQDYAPLLHILQKALDATRNEQLVIYQTHSQSDPALADHFELTAEEQSWINSNPVVRLGVDSAWPPFEWVDEQGKLQGISSEYIKHIEVLTGLEIETVSGIAWGQVIEGLKNGTIDMSSATTPSPERRKYLKFTQSYTSYPVVIMTRKNDGNPRRLKEYAGSTVGTGRGYVFQELIEKQHPNLNLKLFNSPEEGLTALVVGEIQAYVGSLGVLTHIVREKNLVNLEVVGIAKSLGNSELHMATRTDLPLLTSILSKALAAISEDTKREISQKWIKIETREPASPAPLSPHNQLTLLFAPIGLLAAAFCGIAYWISRLLTTARRDPLNYSFNPRTIKIRILLFNALLVMVMMFWAWIGLSRVKEQVRSHVEQTLNTVLAGAHGHLREWAYKHMEMVEILANSSFFAKTAENQITNFNENSPLSNSKELEQLRTYILKRQKFYGDLGFFLIAPDGTSVASMRNTNIGTPNLIAQTYPELFKRVLSGETLLIPPLPSDVPLPNTRPINGTTTPPTMFFATPVRNSAGQIFAVLTQRVDPNTELSGITRQNQLGETGQTFLLNHDGSLLTEHRFPEKLVRAGLISEGSKGVLAVSLRDPGRNLLKSEPLVLSPDKFPFTRMAQQVLKGSNGSNLEGYRNACGETVIGSWIWDNQLNLGIACEIRTEEAYSVLNTTYLLAITTLSVTLILALLFTSINLHIAGKAGRILQAANDQLEEKVKERTEQLEQSERHFRSLVTNIPGAVYRTSLGDPRIITYVSDRIEELTGYPADHFKNNDISTYRSIIHPDDLNAVEESFSNSIAENKLCQVEHRIRHKDGSIRWISAMVQAIPDQQGDPTHLDGILMDIDKRKRSELQLRKLSSAVEQSPATVVITDKEGTIEYVNPAFTKVTGYTAEEAIGRNPNILKSGNLRSDFYKELWETILSGKIWQGDFNNKTKNDEIIWERSAIAPLFGEAGEITHFVAVKEDVTQRKQMEADLIEAKEIAEEATRAKGDFLANMSHEIRTPLNAIVGMGYLMGQTQLTRQQSGYQRKMHSASRLLLATLNSILDFSKIEAGGMLLEPTEFLIDDVLRDVSDINSDQAREKGLELLYSYKGSDATYVIGDPLRLSQILNNLVGNAIKFTETGSVILSADIVADTDSHIAIRFTVRDTGIGLTTAQKKNMFQAFNQADNSTTRQYSGIGLGLSICERLAGLMGGRIDVESEFGKGSIFSFSIELGRGRKKPTKNDDIRELRNLRVLVIDDNREVPKILQLMLRDYVGQVDSANNGRDGLRMIAEAKQPYGLVISDCFMPEVSGFDVCRNLRKPGMPIPAPKVIMATGFLQDQLRQMEDQNLYDAYILKPFSPSDVFDAIARAFGKFEHLLELTKGPVSDAGKPLEQFKDARILLVEDNEINQEVACEMLETVGLKVDIAWHGKDAIEKVQSKSYDLVLMDLQMPVMGGYEATKRIRADKRNEHLPILAMTANVMAHDRKMALTSGMNDHIPKPIEPSVLFGTIAKWLSASMDPALTSGKTTETDEQDGILDTVSALRRMGGNRKLYTRILRKFVEEFALAADEIETAYANGEQKAAQRYAHTLKGVSANIGAEQLRQVTSALELDLKDGVSHDDALAVFRSTLATTIAAAEKKARETEADTLPAGGLPPGDLQTLHTKIRKLEPLLENNKPQASRELATALLKNRWPEPFGTLIVQLDRALVSYDFEQAKETRGRIAKEIEKITCP